MRNVRCIEIECDYFYKNITIKFINYDIINVPLKFELFYYLFSNEKVYYKALGNIQFKRCVAEEIGNDAVFKARERISNIELFFGFCNVENIKLITNISDFDRYKD